jgi:hypothetical protein
VIPAQAETKTLRHSRAGGNPAKIKTFFTKYFVERQHILKALDSRLRGNDNAKQKSYLGYWKNE